MDTFAPEFSKFWLAESEAAPADVGRRADDDASKQRAALEELADLVSAARCIV